MKIYTIGFAGKTAEEFFGLLDSADAKYLVDTRLNNKSQLAGFTKKGNIEFFTEKLAGMTYLEMPMLAPEKEMFSEYRKEGDWSLYESRYIRLLEDRGVSESIDREVFGDGVVLSVGDRIAVEANGCKGGDVLLVAVGVTVGVVMTGGRCLATQNQIMEQTWDSLVL